MNCDICLDNYSTILPKVIFKSWNPSLRFENLKFTAHILARVTCSWLLT